MASSTSSPFACLLLVLPLLLVACNAPLDTTRGERAQGVASWYGEELAGRPTASGERFNPNDLTAAHKTLPFGTRLRVTNLENSKSVVVRINDRFPGTKGRIIDLSRAAFERIERKERGVVQVEIEVLR